MNKLDPNILNNIVHQLSELYVRNDCPISFIERHHGTIPLCNYLCFSYGVKRDSPKRVIEILYFLSKSYSGNQIPYEIALYNQEHKNYDVFWVENTGVLRKDFLKFTKKTHLFRNTFLYDPVSQAIYRLHELKPYLHLPCVSIEGKTIWTSQWNHYQGTSFEHHCQDTAIVPKYSKYKQILDLCDELNRLIHSCHSF